jgi:hypothetical protein
MGLNTSGGNKELWAKSIHETILIGSYGLKASRKQQAVLEGIQIPSKTAFLREHTKVANIPTSVCPPREAVSEGAGGLKSHSKPGLLGEHTKVGSICFLPLCVLLATL